MLTIINLTDLFDEACEANAENIYDKLQSYFINNDVRLTVAQIDEKIVLGSSDRERFLDVVGHWNDGIRSAARTAVTAWLEHAPLNDMVSYQARLRMSEADDHFHVNGLHCIVQINQFGSIKLHTVLNVYDRMEMEQNPQNYAIADVTFDEY